MMKNLGTVIGMIIGFAIVLLIKTTIVFFGLAILRKYGVPIYNFTFWEVLILRWAIVQLFPSKSSDNKEKDL